MDSFAWVEFESDGQLGVTQCPLGGEELRGAIRELRDGGVDVIVSMLTESEIELYEVGREGDFCRDAGIEFISIPIKDGSIPESMSDVREVVDDLVGHLKEGRNIILHCLAGIGRSPTIAACVMVVSGVSPEEAFARITTARGIVVPQTDQQREWVEKFAASLAP